MNNEPELIITVAGSPYKYGDVERIKRLSHIKIIRIDSEVKLEERNFAGINYRYVWTGKIKNWYALTVAHRVILEEISKYLVKWEYSVKVNLSESGE